MNKQLLDIAEKLGGMTPSKHRTLAGLDGFVDTIVHVVDTRKNPDEYERVKMLTDYGNKFIAAAGFSMNIEMVPVTAKLGGVATIYANALKEQGYQVTYIGALGKKNVHPIFQDFADAAEEIISISEPGMSDAVEFHDGKVISSKLEPLKDVNWTELMKHTTPEHLAHIFDRSEFLMFADWTLLINVMSIWNGVVRDVFPLMENEQRRPFMFDLADPTKRSREDIMEAMRCLPKFQEKFDVILGLNEREARCVTNCFQPGKGDTTPVAQLALFLRETLGIAQVVIHTLKGATAADADGISAVPGPYCENPVLTTGGGDNFNAGFVSGQMLGLTMQESLLMGTANSGFYVRNARSANFQELRTFLKDWGEGRVKERLVETAQEEAIGGMKNQQRGE